MSLHALCHLLTSRLRAVCWLRPRLGRAGAVAVVTAVAAPLLLLIVGFVADFAYASYINQRLARAADSATLGSVSQTAATAAGGYGNLNYLQTTGTNIFNANLAQIPITGVNFLLSVVSDGSGGVIATSTFNTAVPTFFAKILGIGAIPVSGGTKTTARPLTYVNYYVIVDTSQSMGIGATKADMDALYQRVLSYNNAESKDGGCVFGCHVKQRFSNGTLQQYTNEDLAHNYGTPLTLRIDSALSAVKSIVSSAATIAKTTQNIKFGIYTIAIDPVTNKRVNNLIDPPSSNYDDVQTATAKISLSSGTSTATGQTNFHNEIADFLSGLSSTLTQGSGASASSPLNYVFLVTDGVNDVPGLCTSYGVCVTAFDPSDCNAMKANATVGVIYTTYLQIFQKNDGSTPEDRYKKLVLPIQDQIKPNLLSCATGSDWFFQADDGPTLVSSMQSLFAKTQASSARIVQ